MLAVLYPPLHVLFTTRLNVGSVLNCSNARFVCNRMTPLHVACGPVVKITPRQFEICRLLIAAKADVNRTGFKYDTSRHTKAKHPHLFERCNDHLVFSASTPLHEASYYNKVDICRMLIACKANAAARNMCGHC